MVGNEFEDFVRQAAIYKAKGTSVVRAVARAYQEAGQEELMSFLGRKNVNFKRALSQGQMLGRFKVAWARLFNGVLLPLIDETPAKGWSTEVLVNDYNNARGGMPLSSLEVIRATSADQRVEGLIFRCLVQAQRDLATGPQPFKTPPGWFFQSDAAIRTIGPVHDILKVYGRNAFRQSVLIVGQQMDRCAAEIQL